MNLQEEMEPSGHAYQLLDITEATGSLLRNLIGFWLLGFLNNIAYVLNNAAAGKISPDSIAVTYLCSIGPGVFVSLSAPYWFHLVSYNFRMIFSTICLGTGCVLIQMATTESWQLFGVCLCSVQSSIGEATCLALSQKYKDSKKCLVLWSSGTGFAGPGGYVLALFVFSLMNPLGVTISGLVISLSYLITFFFVLTAPTETSNETEVQEQERRASVAFIGSLSLGEKCRLVCSLWPYIVPLYLVYWSEYAMQSGTWTAFAFPNKSLIHEEDVRDHTYKLLNLFYQIGVFISRSSGMLIDPTRKILWMMPVIQVCLLVFFILDSGYAFWEGYSLVAPAFVSGLLGGAVYVNCMTLVDKEVKEEAREFSLAASTLSVNFGILMASITGLYVQWCLFEWNSIIQEHTCPFV